MRCDTNCSLLNTSSCTLLDPAPSWHHPDPATSLEQVAVWLCDLIFGRIYNINNYQLTLVNFVSTSPINIRSWKILGWQFSIFFWCQLFCLFSRFPLILKLVVKVVYDGDGCFDEAVYLNHDNKYSLYVKVGGLWLRDLSTNRALSTKVRENFHNI